MYDKALFRGTYSYSIADRKSWETLDQYLEKSSRQSPSVSVHKDHDDNRQPRSTHVRAYLINGAHVHIRYGRSNVQISIRHEHQAVVDRTRNRIESLILPN